MLAIPAVLGAVFLALLWRAGRAASARMGELSSALVEIREVLAAAYRVDETGVEQRFRDLEDLVDRLPQRWEEIKREAGRLDARARYAVGRARSELAESGLADERLEELGSELHLVDDGGSGGGPVSPLPTPLEVAPQQAGDASWLAAANKVKFGGM